MKKKFWTIFLITFAIETGITYFLSSQFTVRFIEVMFFTGIVFLITSIYFSGGLSNKMLELGLKRASPPL